MEGPPADGSDSSLTVGTWGLGDAGPQLLASVAGWREVSLADRKAGEELAWFGWPGGERERKKKY